MIRTSQHRNIFIGGWWGGVSKFPKYTRQARWALLVRWVRQIETRGRKDSTPLRAHRCAFRGPSFGLAAPARPAVILQYFDGNWAKVHTGKSIMIRSQLGGQSCRPKISPTHYLPPPNFLLNFPNLPSLYDCKVGELGTWGLGGRFKLRVTFLPKSPKTQAAQVDKSPESPTVTFITMQSIHF